MDTELLKTFLEVRNTRHFGKAAENLYLTQAAVSARIKQLETILGAPLFTRYRNNLQLTVTGERLINHAETILIAWDRARQDLSLKKKQKHALAVGATSGLWDLVLQDALMSVHEQHPDVAIRAEAYAAPALTRHLIERTLDLALIYEPAKVSDLVSEPITPAELILVSSRQERSPLEAMATQYVAVDWGLSFQLSFTQFFPDTPPPVLHTSLARIALEFLLRFGGCAYLPQRMVEPYLGERLFQVSEAPVIARQIYACYHQECLHGREIEYFLSVIRAQEIPPQHAPQRIEL